MKKVTFLFFLVVLNIYGQTPMNDAHWNLLWQDEFNFFDDNIWVKANYAIHGIEPQIYLESNVTTSNGELIISLNNNQVICPPNVQQTTYGCGICYPDDIYSFNSGWVENKHESKSQFGYLEARIKLPYDHGLWPAFWLYQGVPTYQEVDIFEMTPGVTSYEGSSFTQSIIHSTTNVHTAAPAPAVYPAVDPNGSGSAYIMDDYTQWHVYGIEWSPSKIIWYLDGYPIRYYQNIQIMDPLPIIFNLAITPHDPAQWYHPNVPDFPEIFPAIMRIDYVRVYELEKECTQFINTGNYDFSTYNNKEKNFISIGGNGFNNSLELGDDIILRASEYIDILGEFNVPIGSSLYMDVNTYCPVIDKQCSFTFNPCTFNFANYDNLIKKEILLGGNSCVLNISPTNNDLNLHATDQIVLKPGVSISTIPSRYVELKIVPCQE